jgi:hypothetical protein
MRKSLRRVLERLRAASNDAFGKRTHPRGGLQAPQRLQPVRVPALSPARR